MLTYAVGTSFIMAAECLSEQGQRLLHVLTRAKKNIVACEPAAPKEGRGRPAVYGKKIKLASLFTQKKQEFTSSWMRLYGKKSRLSYYLYRPHLEAGQAKDPFRLGPDKR